MAKSDVLEKARSRFKELSTIIQAADGVRAEWAKLQEFLAMAQQLFPDDVGDGTPAVPAVEHPSGNGQPSLTIADRAEQILQKRGRLHLKQLLQEMRAAGWKATENDTNDLKNLRSTMDNRKERFSNTGKNVWEIRARIA